MENCNIQKLGSDAFSYNINNNSTSESLRKSGGSATVSDSVSTDEVLFLESFAGFESSEVLNDSRQASEGDGVAINLDEQSTALSFSESELSDTESAHQSLSMSSPEDGPQPEGGDDDDDDDDDDADDDDDEPSASVTVTPTVAISVTDFNAKNNGVGNDDDGVNPLLTGSIEDVIGVTASSAVELTRSREESDQEYARRLRKQNYLNLAQEFVDRKAAAAMQEIVVVDEREAAVTSGVMASVNFDGHLLERSKNVRNVEKSFPNRERSDSPNDFSGSPSVCQAPSIAVASESTVNQNAIHHHHQRSLVNRSLNRSCHQSSTSPALMQTEPLITSPKHVCIPRRISFKTPASCVDIDLPANVAKMAAVNSIINGPPANAAFQRPLSVGPQHQMKSSMSVDRQKNRTTSSRSRRHTYQYDTSSGAGPHRSTSSSASSSSSSSFSKKELHPTNKNVGSPAPNNVLYSSDDVVIGRFDVYNIETTMPTIDWVAMEEHLTKAAKEQDIFHKHHRNNREEIRRKLAMGSDNDDYYGGERTPRKPSLQTRLQSGMNLQICFMNETVGEQESTNQPEQLSTSSSRSTAASITGGGRSTLTTTTGSEKSFEVVAARTSAQDSSAATMTDKLGGGGTGGFVSRQAKLQAEARMALAQAKQMAHMQMEVEKQRKKKSPIAEMVGIPFPDGRRKVSRHALCEMNVAQLQVIVNDLHSQIESLNEDLVQMLLDRDDLHMEQDSMLVDIEDLTRYVGAKDQALRDDQCGGGVKPPSSRLKIKKKFLVK